MIHMYTNDLLVLLTHCNLFAVGFGLKLHNLAQDFMKRLETIASSKPEDLRDPLLDILTNHAVSGVTPVPEIPPSFPLKDLCVGNKNEEDFARLREEEYLWAVSKMQFPSYYKLVHTVYADFQQNNVTPYWDLADSSTSTGVFGLETNSFIFHI
jgi:hypothetical protein